MKYKVKVTVFVDVELEDHLDPAWFLEENACPGTGYVGAAIESAIDRAKSTGTCWSCPDGKCELVAP